MLSYKFIINPIPLKKKHRALLEKLRQNFVHNKFNFSFEFTTKDRNGTAVAKNSGKYDVVVACGGDGTIMEVINGIHAKSKLGILPLGTSNDFAKQVGINLENCIDVLLIGKSTKIDLGSVEFKNNGKSKKMLFCSTSGIGFDARLLQLNKYKTFIKFKKVLSNLIYPICAFFLMFSYKSHECEIKLNNKTVNINLFMLNTNFVKSMSGMKVTPNANIDNGVFDLIIFEETNIFRKLVGFIWYCVTSKKIGFREIDYISKNNLGDNKYNLRNVKSFSIKSKNTVEVQLNGDFVGCTPAKFRILPHALDLIK